MARASNKRKPRGYWTKERILNDAKQYSYQAEWIKASSGGYGAAKRKGLVKEACAHMTGPRKPMGYWTLDRLKEDAAQYSSRSAWKRGSTGYRAALEQGVLDECCAHMELLVKPVGYWTKAKCIESAQQFDTIQEWSVNETGAYDKAKRRGWLNECTAHMVKVLSHGERTIYSFLLQHDLKFEYQKRFDDIKDKRPMPFDFYLPDFELVIEYQGRQHFDASQTSMYRKNLKGLQKRDALKRKRATEKGLSYLSLDAEKTREIEAAIVRRLEQISRRKGLVLKLKRRPLTRNEKKTLANLGQWSKEEVIKDAKNYKTKAEWGRCGNAAYQIARKNGWIEEATAHMKSPIKPHGYWTKERVFEDASKYSSKMEWYRESQSAWQTAQRNGWLPEIAFSKKTAN